jgi:hypothetical protein
MKIKLLIMVTMAILTIALAIYGNAFWIFTGLTTAALFDNLTSEQRVFAKTITYHLIKAIRLLFSLRSLKMLMEVRSSNN